MQKTCTTYHSYLSKVFFGLACLWAVFLFSGYVETDVLTLPEIATTELTKKKVKTSPFVSFQKAEAIRCVLTTQNYSFYQRGAALNLYNDLIETAFLQLKKERFHYLIWRPFLPNKAFPVSSKLDAPSSLIS